MAPHRLPLGAGDARRAAAEGGADPAVLAGPCPPGPRGRSSSTDGSVGVLAVPAPRLRPPALAVMDQGAATRTSRSWRRRHPRCGPISLGCWGLPLRIGRASGSALRHQPVGDRADPRKPHSGLIHQPAGARRGLGQLTDQVRQPPQGLFAQRVPGVALHRRTSSTCTRRCSVLWTAWRCWRRSRPLAAALWTWTRPCGGPAGSLRQPRKQSALTLCGRGLHGLVRSPLTAGGRRRLGPRPSAGSGGSSGRGERS